jgi:hypothetical protein
MSSVQIEIKSRLGTFITLDKEVADKIGGWSWWLRPNGNAMAHLPGSGLKNRKIVLLSRAVIWAVTGEWPKEGTTIEYVNGDKLDGRMENISVYFPNIIKIEGTSSVQIEIKSRSGTFITLDKEVAEKIGHWGWYLNELGYVRAHLPESGKKGKHVRLARAVLWASTGEWPEKGKVVDHINHDPLDNRMCNLRVVTRSINQRNMNKQEGTSSQFQGVRWQKQCQKWLARATVTIDGEHYCICSSLTPDEAIAALCTDCIRDLVGGFLPRNFPERIFLDKWKEIGEKQRRQIFHSMAKNNVPIYDNTIFIERKVA